MKNIISELKNTVQGIKSRLNEAEDQNSELGDKVEKKSQKVQEKEKRLKKNKWVKGNGGQHEMRYYPYNQDTSRRRRKAKNRKPV